MINDLEKSPSEDWFQFCWEDEKLLSGISVSNLLKTLSVSSGDKLVRASDADGAFGPNLFNSDKLYSLDEFSSLIHQITQFDWANIFVGQRAEITANELKPNEEAFSNFEYVVCLADSTYFNVYTRDPQIDKELTKKFPAATRKVCSFGDLEFMY